MGAKLKYSTDKQNSRLYYVIQPPQAEDCGKIQTGIDANPAPSVYTNLPEVDDLPLLPNDFEANAYLKDLLISTVPGKELAGACTESTKDPHTITFTITKSSNTLYRVS